MKIGNHTIKLTPHKSQKFPKGLGRVIMVGKDKRYPEFYGKWHWFILVKYEKGGKEIFTFNMKDECIENKAI